MCAFLLFLLIFLYDTIERFPSYVPHSLSSYRRSKKWYNVQTYPKQSVYILFRVRISIYMYIRIVVAVIFEYRSIIVLMRRLHV